MKKVIYLVIVFVCVTITNFLAQNVLHPTISEVIVQYSAVAQNTAPINPGDALIQAIPQVTIALTSGSNVSKIYFEILDAQTSAILYQVNYQMSSAAVFNSSGKKLFENTNGTIFVSPGQTVSLRPYKFQIKTEDNQQIMSVVYSTIR